MSPGRARRDGVSPELPSTLWPYAIAVVVMAALGLQVWSLLGLLEAGRQADLNDVDQLREQASLLSGTIDSLQTQRDQLDKTTATQTKTLELLRANEATLRKQLRDLEVESDGAKSQRQQTEHMRDAALEATASSKAENDQLVVRGRAIKDAIAGFENSKQAAEQQVATQQSLIARNQQTLKSLEAQLSQVDEFLQLRLTEAAKAKLQQERAAQLVKDIQIAETKLAVTQTEITTKADRLEELKATIAKTALPAIG